MLVTIDKKGDYIANFKLDNKSYSRKVYSKMSYGFNGWVINFKGDLFFITINPQTKTAEFNTKDIYK